MQDNNQLLYPEHDKLGRIDNLTQAVGDFIVWLGENGMCIAEEIQGGVQKGNLVPVGKNINQLLAAHFKIDIKKLEEEKRSMLKHIQRLRDASNAKSQSVKKDESQSG